MVFSSIRAVCLVAAMFVQASEAFMSPALVGGLSLRQASTSAVSSLSMAGFGKEVDMTGKRSSQAKTKIMGIPKKLLTDYGDLVKDGAKTIRVFAGVPGEGKWFECGLIASKGDKTTEACQLNKRLILEYAADFYPALKPKKAKLVVGYSKSGDSEEDVMELVKPASTDGVESGFLPKRKLTTATGLNLFHIDGRPLPISFSGEDGEAGAARAEGGGRL